MAISANSVFEVRVAGSGLSVLVTAGTAIVGNVVEWGAGTVGALPNSGTSGLYLHQDGTWVWGTAVPAPGTTHGYAMLWARVVAAGGTVSSVTQTRRQWSQGLSQVYPYAGTPPVTQSGDLWFNTAATALWVQQGTLIYSGSALVGTAVPVAGTAEAPQGL